MKTDNFNLIFLYLSEGFNRAELFNLLDVWIENKTPTAILGDVNWDFSDDCRMKKFMEARKFQQLVDTATCDSGRLIDHVYVNESLMLQNVFTQKFAVHYSDHDIVSLFIPKQK